MKKLYATFVLVFIVFVTCAFQARELPKVFLIGDSISIRYGTFLKEYTKGVVQLDRKEDDGSAEKNLDVPTGANGGDSRMVLDYLKVKTLDGKFKPNYLLLNCGLHDIKRYPESKETQVSSANYVQNLNSIAALLQKNDIQLIWMRTTPVVDSIHNAIQPNFKRYNADLMLYNQIADSIMDARNIPVIDLHGFSEKLGLEAFIDHVHYSEPARKMQGAFIAGYLRGYLFKKNKI